MLARDSPSSTRTLSTGNQTMQPQCTLFHDFNYQAYGHQHCAEDRVTNLVHLKVDSTDDQRRDNVLYLNGRRRSQQMQDVGSMLAQRWTNVKPTMLRCIVSAGVEQIH